MIFICFKARFKAARILLLHGTLTKRRQHTKANGASMLQACVFASPGKDRVKVPWIKTPVADTFFGKASQIPI